MRLSQISLALTAPRRSGASGPVNSATAWYFASLGLAGTPWADVSRTGLGTRVDSAGLVGFGPHNLIQQSNDPSAAAWNKTRATAVGTKVIPTAASGSHYINQGSALSGVSVAVQARAGEYGVLQIAAASTSNQYVNFNLATGQIGTIGTEASNVSMVAVGGGEYRCSVSFATTTALGAIFAVAPLATSPWLPSFVGNDSDGLFISQIQLNQGALTAYIPTTTAARYLPRITHDPALDINGVPYTVTEQYGAELVVNGDFPVNTTGWTTANSAVLTVGANGVTIQNNGASAGYLYQAMTTVIGRSYLITGSIVYGGPGFARIEVSTTITNPGGGNISASASGSYRWVFTATATTTYIIIGNRNDTNAAHTYDNISVREYLGTVTNGTPRPLGLLVEGQATNLYPVSDTPSTRTVTVTAAVHTLSVYGTCTITLSGAATGTLTATGAANIRTTLTFTPSAGSLTMTVSGLTTGNRAQLETGSIATSYIPNPGTGTAVRVADWTGPGVALTGAALAAAFPAGFGQNTIVLKFRKRGSSGGVETLMALSNGSFYGAGSGLLVRANGTAMDMGGNSSAISQAAVLALDGSTVNTVAISWSGANYTMSVNGVAPASAATLDFTGVGTTTLTLGSLTPGGAQTLSAATFESIRVLPGQYITGAALQALTA